MTLVEILKNNYQEIFGPNPTQRTGANVAGGSLDTILQRLLADPKALEGLNDQQYTTLQNILGLRGEQETREYNRALLQEQRAYDDPQAQLSRLMATGMSREAALQAIAGGAAGGSTQAAAGQSPQMQLGLSPSESELNKVQAATSIANSVFGGLSSLAGIAQFGINIPTALATGSLHKAQAIALHDANNAQEGSAEFNAIVEYAKRKKYINPSKLSFDDCVTALQAVNDSRIQDFFKEGGTYDSLIGSPLGFRISNENYSTRFGSQDALSRLHHTAALTACANANAESLAKSIDVQDATIQKIFADIVSQKLEDSIKEQRLPLELQNLAVDARLKTEQAEQAYQVTRKEKNTADIIAVSARRMQLTAETYDDIACQQAFGALQRAYAENDPQVLEKECKAIFNNAEYRNQIAWFNVVSTQQLHNLKKSNPVMFDQICKWKIFMNEANIGQVFHDALSEYTSMSNNPNLGNIELRSNVRDFLGTWGYIVP